jgi:precorrin-6B methylase 2
MTIHLARVVDEVVAVDINPTHLKLAEANAERAGLKNITFILGDITNTEILNKIGNIDGAFLDPDWAKTGDSKEIHVTDLEGMVPNGRLLFNLISSLTPNIAYRLPKEIDKTKLIELPLFEEEVSSMNGKTKFYTFYFGDLKK